MDSCPFSGQTGRLCDSLSCFTPLPPLPPEPQAPVIPVPTPEQVNYELRINENGEYELVPGSPINVPGPELYNLKGWSFNPENAVVSIGVANHGLTLWFFQINAPTALSHIVVGVDVSPVNLIPGECFAGIYSADGMLLASTDDISGLMEGAMGIVSIPLAESVLLEPGFYYVGLLLGSSTSQTGWYFSTETYPLLTDMHSDHNFYGLTPGPHYSLPDTIPVTGLYGQPRIIWFGFW